MTLLVESPAGSGTFVVPAASTHLPATNPQVTLVDGSYGWVVIPGTYKVRAEKDGFVLTEADPVTIPPPVTGLDLALTPVDGCQITGDIVVKPGDDHESGAPVNPSSNGVIPVAILTTDTFDATTVDPGTVRFGPSGATIAHEQGHLVDVDGDGDLVVQRFCIDG